MTQMETPNPDIDVLLLDFGGVCLLNPVELHQKTEKKLGLKAGSLGWVGPLDPTTDPLWTSMVAGELTEREYWHRRASEIGEAAGRALSLRDYMDLIYNPPTDELIRDDAVRVAKAASAAGYQVSVLTNDLRDFHGREWEHGIGFLQNIDHLIDCSDTKILKPDPRAFDRAVGIVDTAPDRVLFVDDQPLNVEGAADFGLNAVWFDIANADEAWADVGRRLGLSSI